MIRSMDVLTASRTEQILSRYRPIAPKPQLFPSNAPPFDSPPNLPPPPPPPPYPPNFTNLLQQQQQQQQQQQKPCKSRKRNIRGGGASFSAHKRAKCNSITDLALAANTQLGLSLPALNPISTTPTRRDLVTLPLLPCGDETETPEMEKDLLGTLLGGGAAAAKKKKMSTTTVIVPQPVRAVGSSISVGCISESKPGSESPPVPKKPEEVEQEVESEALPSVVSDSNNRVRLANSAYKEMVGQPECPWLDSVAASRRLSGGVMLDLSNTSVPVPSNGFSCRARIEWPASNGRKIFINAACDVTRLSCDSKDYRYTWRFHTREAF